MPRKFSSLLRECLMEKIKESNLCTCSNLHCNHKPMQDPLADPRMTDWWSFPDDGQLQPAPKAVQQYSHCIYKPFTTLTKHSWPWQAPGSHIGLPWTRETSLKQSLEVLDIKRRIPEAVEKLHCFAKGDTRATEQNLKQEQETEEFLGCYLGRWQKAMSAKRLTNTHKADFSEERL